ncbi:pyridoxamine kinase [Clostridium tarantellae]|uniref:pyridoxal kinase n=1 Tax=Clostridium tarantellae TaxID=39493 RepID=A0A6I1MMD8_9CLOT|nr:pyridoxamine kinase [Clostridium tarantellae]MPQ44174.1 pyridoxamine kinase [Clostridium tarantellae]
MKNINKVAAIHDISCYGRAALATIIPILSVMKNQVCALPTAVLSTHTAGFGKPAINDLTDFLYKTKDHWRELNLEFQCIYSGYLANSNQIEFVKEFINDFNGNNPLIVIDPVMADNGFLYSTMTEEMVKKMKDLIKHANIITPNITEACFLLGEKYNEEYNEEQIKNFLIRLSEIGPEKVIITSAPSVKGDKFLDTVAYDKNKEEFITITHKKIKAFYCGTGDAFASILVGSLLNENTLKEAMEKACNFIIDGIEYSEKFKYAPNEGILLEGVLYKLANK